MFKVIIASTDFVTANSFVSFLLVTHDYLKTWIPSSLFLYLHLLIFVYSISFLSIFFPSSTLVYEKVAGAVGCREKARRRRRRRYECFDYSHCTPNIPCVCDVVEWCLGLFRRRQLSESSWDRKESRRNSKKPSRGNRNKNLSETQTRETVTEKKEREKKFWTSDKHKAFGWCPRTWWGPKGGG